MLGSEKPQDPGQSTRLDAAPAREFGDVQAIWVAEKMIGIFASAVIRKAALVKLPKALFSIVWAGEATVAQSCAHAPSIILTALMILRLICS